MRLEAQGYEVAEAADGEEGLAKVRELKPDLVLLDIMMPKREGISVVRELKADPDLCSIPVILVTAKADTKDVGAGEERGRDFEADAQSLTENNLICRPPEWRALFGMADEPSRKVC